MQDYNNMDQKHLMNRHLKKPLLTRHNTPDPTLFRGQQENQFSHSFRTNSALVTESSFNTIGDQYIYSSGFTNLDNFPTSQVPAQTAKSLAAASNKCLFTDNVVEPKYNKPFNYQDLYQKISARLKQQRNLNSDNPLGMSLNNLHLTNNGYQWKESFSSYPEDKLSKDARFEFEHAEAKFDVSQKEIKPDHFKHEIEEMLDFHKNKSQTQIDSNDRIWYEILDTSHWCYLCGINTASTFDMCQHMLTNSHLQKLGSNDCPWALPTSKCIYRQPIQADSRTDITNIKGIEFLLPVTGFYCRLCETFCGDHKTSEMHLKSDLHRLNYREHLFKFPRYEDELLQLKTEVMTSFNDSYSLAQVKSRFRNSMNGWSSSCPLNYSTMANVDGFDLSSPYFFNTLSPTNRSNLEIIESEGMGDNVSSKKKRKKRSRLRNLASLTNTPHVTDGSRSRTKNLSGSSSHFLSSDYNCSEYSNSVHHNNSPRNTQEFSGKQKRKRLRGKRSRGVVKHHPYNNAKVNVGRGYFE